MPTHYVEDHPKANRPESTPATPVVEAKVVDAPAKVEPKKAAAKVETK